jgi:hypothetical protein
MHPSHHTSNMPLIAEGGGGGNVTTPPWLCGCDLWNINTSMVQIIIKYKFPDNLCNKLPCYINWLKLELELEGSESELFKISPKSLLKRSIVC